MQPIELTSKLDAPAGRVWERVTTFEGVNDELRPLLRMTAPRQLQALDPADVRLGERMFRSWVLLFGLLPVDYDDLTLIALEPGRGFHERSRMLSMRVWEHERWIEPDGADACLLRDRLTFEPRGALPRAFVAAIVRALFRHRHRRLRRYFGGLALSAGEQQR
jgi:ligand-binding SRPBCC domain-containing protein